MIEVMRAQERFLQAVKLVATLMRERYRDLSVISAQSESIPPSALTARTKAFNTTSAVLAEASTAFAHMSKGHTYDLSEWTRIEKSCETVLGDLAAHRSLEIEDDVQDSLACVAALQGKQISPIARNLAKRYWSRIGRTDPEPWLKASDEALEFFLVFFLIDDPIAESPMKFNSLPAQTRAEVVSLIKTLDDDDRWRFERHMELNA